MVKRIMIILAVFVFCISIVGIIATESKNKAKMASNTSIVLSNSPKSWGFKKIKGARPEFAKEYIEPIERYDGRYVGKDTDKYIYLTFDQGYENGHTPRILDVLKKEKVPAAFFVTGDYVKRNEDLVKRMASEGHIIGNHTNNHPSMPAILSDDKLKEEILSLNKMVHDICDINMVYFRPPAGEFSDRTLKITNDVGLKTVFWSFAYVDWERDQIRGEQYAYNAITPYFHNGEIILLHAVSKDNADALERVILNAKECGYTFKTLDDLYK